MGNRSSKKELPEFATQCYNSKKHNLQPADVENIYEAYCNLLHKRAQLLTEDNPIDSSSVI